MAENCETITNSASTGARVEAWAEFSNLSLKDKYLCFVVGGLMGGWVGRGMVGHVGDYNIFFFCTINTYP